MNYETESRWRNWYFLIWLWRVYLVFGPPPSFMASTHTLLYHPLSSLTCCFSSSTAKEPWIETVIPNRSSFKVYFFFCLSHFSIFQFFYHQFLKISLEIKAFGSKSFWLFHPLLCNLEWLIYLSSNQWSSFFIL